MQVVKAEWGPIPYACAGVGGTQVIQLHRMRTGGCNSLYTLEICGIILIQEVLHISTGCFIMIVKNYKLNVHAGGSII